MKSDLPLCELSDEQVVELAKTGDDEAFAHIVTRYKNFVYSKVKVYFIKGADKDDLIQEGMIGLFKAVRGFKPDVGSFSNFANLCVMRQILTAVKNSTRNKHMPLNTYISLNGHSANESEEEYIPEFAGEDHSLNPENILIDRENVNGITCRINQNLSKLELSVLALYLDGHPYQDIAKKIGKDIKAVDNAIQRIRKKIEKILEG